MAIIATLQERHLPSAPVVRYESQAHVATDMVAELYFSDSKGYTIDMAHCMTVISSRSWSEWSAMNVVNAWGMASRIRPSEEGEHLRQVKKALSQLVRKGWLYSSRKNNTTWYGINFDKVGGA